MATNNRPSSEESFAFMSETLKDFHRPRLFFSIVPQHDNQNLLDVVLRNSGGSAAYDITCSFNPDLRYYEERMLSGVSILKNLPFLEQQQEIRFFFRDLPSILDEGKAYGSKQTEATVKYRDSSKVSYEETFPIDIERYVGILSVERHNINDLYKELGLIRRELEKIQSRGLITKTTEDVKREKVAYDRWLKKTKASKGKDHNNLNKK